jgi:nicotinamide mononucleotide (NMN) deamidase PncC
MQDEDVATRIAELLGERMIATAESCTAGRVAETLASVEKAAEAAEQMASGAADLFGADVTVSTTGVAGDAEEDGTPPGTVYIGTYVDGVVASKVHRFEGSPQQVCDQARRQPLVDLVDAMSGDF